MGRIVNLPSMGGSFTMTRSESGAGGEQIRPGSINEICSRFKDAWKKILDQGGDPPRIDDFLTVPAGRILESEGGEGAENVEPVAHNVFDESPRLLLRQCRDGAILLVVETRMDESRAVR
jgi:hypothetical protein